MKYLYKFLIGFCATGFLVVSVCIGYLAYYTKGCVEMTSDIWMIVVPASILLFIDSLLKLVNHDEKNI